MTTGYVKSYRSIFDHWVADDPKTFMAWQEITHFAAYAEYTVEVCGQVIKLERGQVNISNLESRKHFTDKQWRSFLERLIECRMIARSTVHRLGRGNGSIAVYDVLSYEKYQSNSEGTSMGTPNGVLKGGSKERAERVEAHIEGTPNGTSMGTPNGTSYKKNIKEDKELTPPTPPDEPPLEVPRERGSFSTNLLQSQHPQVFATLCKIKSIAKANDPQFRAWCERVLSDCRSYAPEKTKTILEDMVLSWGDLNMPWKWYAKQLEGIQAGSAAPPAVDYGDVVRHPEHGEWLVDRVDPVARKCEHSEKYFWVPMSEVTVVRRRSDCYA